MVSDHLKNSVQAGKVVLFVIGSDQDNKDITTNCVIITQLTKDEFAEFLTLNSTATGKTLKTYFTEPGHSCGVCSWQNSDGMKKIYDDKKMAEIEFFDSLTFTENAYWVDYKKLTSEGFWQPNPTPLTEAETSEPVPIVV